MPEPVEILREIELGGVARRVLVRQGSAYYVVSTLVAELTGVETLVFPANADGEVTSWQEVGGGQGVTRDEAIARLERDGAWP